VPHSPLPRTSVATALAVCLANWLVPGLGYVLCRDVTRGVILFITINACFAIGLYFGGYILIPPSWTPTNPNFNLVTVLTYLVQAFHGGGWLALQALHHVSAGDTEALFNLKRMAASTYSDLGAFHLVVAGGLNYFASVRLYDLLAGSPELTQEPSAKGASGAPQTPESAGGN
jgi:hypothetical protein